MPGVDQVWGGTHDMMLAEVSDKIVLPPHALIAGLVVGVATYAIGNALSRIRWWIAVIPVALSVAASIVFLYIMDDEPTFHAVVVLERGARHYVYIRVAYACGYLPCIALLCFTCNARRRKVETLLGLCTHCRYSLVGLSTLACPECGKPTTTANSNS